MNNWISVKDRLPKMGQICLVYRPEFCEMFVARYSSRDYLWMDNKGWTYRESSVSHWMLLPEPPQYKGE